MKITQRHFLIVLSFVYFLLFAFGTRAATYYVAPGGNDANTAQQAQSVSAPWKTIQHAANNMIAGDTCIIRAGTYRETVTVPKSGTSSAPITFKAYDGEIVTINGADQVPNTSWVSKGGNIYDATISGLYIDSGSGQVFMNGAMKPEARWPNAGPGFPWNDSSINPSPDWAYADTAGYDSNFQNGWFTDAALPSRASGYWVGAKVHMMAGYAWWLDNATVTAYDDAAKKITTDDAHSDKRGQISAGNEYFITGKKGELDSNGEWFYSPSTSTLSFYSTSGAPTGIEAKKRPYGFDLSGRSYINLINLNFFACTIDSDKYSSYCTFDGLNMKYLGHSDNGADVYGLVMRNHFILKNSELAWDSKGLIVLAGSDIKIFNNHLHDSDYTGIKKAMIWSVDQNGSRNLICYNTMHDSGSQILHSPGVGSVVEYNEMYNACRLIRDNAVVYVGNTDGGNVVLRYNLIHGARGGAGQKGAPNQGLYIDNFNSGWIVHHNIIWDVPNKGMLLNRRHCLHLVFNNVIIGKTGGTTGGYFVGPGNQDGEAGIHIYNNILNGNPQRDVSDMDVRFNCVDDASFVDPANGDFRLQSSSRARDKGIIIPGVTDGYIGSAPDMGALEYGGTDWTQQVGCQSAPLSPEPTFKYPDMIFENKIKDGGFETLSLAPNWTASSGSVTSFQTTLWRDDHVRTQYASLKFSPGTSEIVQTVTGLLPNHTYRVYAGVQNFSSSNSAKIGVRNFGRSTKEMVSPLAPTTTPSAFIYNNLTFTTGPSATSADVYVHVTIPSSGSPVYLDDVGLLLTQDVDPQVGRMPLVEYPFNETSGSVVNDASTHGRNGTVAGTAGWTSGYQGNSLKFDGTSTYVTTPSITTPSDEITIACWVKSSASTWNSTGTIVVQKPALTFGGISGTKKIQVMMNLNGVGASYFGYTPDDTFDITAWHHYVVTHSRLAGLRSIYVDGNWVYSSIYDPAFPAIVPTTAAITLGKDSTHFFSGQIDDLRIYDKALQQEEIRVLYKTDKTLALRLKLDESSGATKAWDCSGFGRNGTLNGFDASTAWVKGKNAGALSFNGSSSYVTTPGMATPSTVSVAAWAKSSPATWNADGCLVSKEPSFVLAPVKGTKNMRFTIKIAGVAKTATFTAGSTFDVTQWHHYLGTYSSSSGNLNLYVDGVLQNTVSGLSGSMDADSGGLIIGRDDAGTNFLSGQVDDVQLYARELSAVDVLDLSLRTFGPYDPATTTNVSSNQPPSANAGADKSITLPTNSVSLSGSGADTDGSIASYAWTQISGPNTASIGSSTSASTTVSGLIEGSYTFRLKVTDNGGLSASDDVNVTVNPVANVAPSANAGVDQTITLPTNSVTLNGSGSDSDGSISSYAWSQVSGPNTATIGSSTSASTTMTGLVQGAYVFRLTVKDNVGASGSDDVNVTVNAAANATPTANAGSDKTIQLPTSSVTLSGSGSDSDGTIASYAWTQVTGPSTATIGTSTSASTTVSALVQGTYTFRLTVKDNAGASASDDVNVIVKAANVSPTANAGADQTITLPTNAVSLNGSGTDSDGSIASYAWSQVSGPSTATISASTSAVTTMGTLVEGTYVFRLTVKDNQGATGTDDVQVTVKSLTNAAPTANAGSDRVITLPTNTQSINSVNLSGSATDTDGTISKYAWTQVSGPTTATISSPASATTTVDALFQGTYIFRLTVTDNLGATGSDDISVRVNAAPVSNAGSDKTIQLPTSSVTLSGSGTDADGTIVSYAWSQASGPSTATIGSSTSATTTVSALVQGTYTFRLIVKDDCGATAPDDVIVTVKAANLVPKANAGADQSITLPTNSVSLTGSATDSDGSIASYAWSQVSGPSTASISAATSAATTMGSLLQGVYVFRLTVKDNQGATGTDDVQVTVNAENVAPTANAGSNKTITLPTTSATLTGTGADTDGTIASYAWTQVSGPNAASIATPTTASTTVSGLVQGVYTFRLTVKDNKGATGTDDVTVTVNLVRQFLVDCGPSSKTTPATSGKAWNNLTTARTNDALTGLVDTSAKTSGIGITVLDGFYQVTAGQGNNNGTTSSTIYPATATADSFFIGTLNNVTDTSAKIRITGLKTSSTTAYTIKLYASRVTTDLTSDRTTVYTINGVAKELQVRNNVDGYVTFDKLTAPNGYLDVTITMKSGAVFGYLGVVDVTETSH